MSLCTSELPMGILGTSALLKIPCGILFSFELILSHLSVCSSAVNFPSGLNIHCSYLLPTWCFDRVWTLRHDAIGIFYLPCKRILSQMHPYVICMLYSLYRLEVDWKLNKASTYHPVVGSTMAAPIGFEIQSKIHVDVMRPWLYAIQYTNVAIM